MSAWATPIAARFMNGGTAMAKTTQKVSVAVLALSVFGFVNAAQANLITNGSFEDTTGFVPDVNDTMSLLAGATTMAGWTVVNGSLAWIGPTNTFSLSASNGSYFLDLTDYRDLPPFGGVTQLITTVPGGHYQLTFDLGSSFIYGLPDSILASAGSTSQVFTSTSLGDNIWQSETLDFFATGTSTAITLTGDSGFKYIGLDNVSVDAIPEPTTLLLLGTGLLGLGLMRRRKARIAAAN
jgi:hypothetical protein